MTTPLRADQNEPRTPEGSETPTEQHDAWALAGSLAADGLWYWNVRRRTVRVAALAEELLGYERGELRQTPADLMRHVDAADQPALRRALLSLLRRKRSRFELEVRLLTRGGSRRWFALRARAQRDAQGRVGMIAGVVSDIDARKCTEERLRHATRHDALTGLPNRATFMAHLTARIARAVAHPEPCFAVLYLDVDRFKLVNDTLGHASGDALLVAVAARMATCLGEDDMLARLSGDEFAVLLDAVGEREQADEAARRFADALVAALEAPVMVDGRQVFVSLNAGVRTSAGTRTTASAVLREADVAMYVAKRAGGARVAHFDASMHETMARRYAVQSELRRAIHAGELSLAYQPIFDVKERVLCGFEALVRWEHPTRGPLTASDFVEEANESGLIVQIGRWVLNEACAQLADWTRGYPNGTPLSVSVNLCDRELLDPDLARTVLRALNDHGIPPRNLTLEMSEGVLSSRGEAAAAVLAELRALGVQLQMDGFGAGKASLAMLRQLPLTSIKLDRSIVQPIAVNEEARVLAATIITYARTLGLAVVAEGVETRAQARALRRLGDCRYVQGHYFGRPSESVGAGELLEAPMP